MIEVTSWRYGKLLTHGNDISVSKLVRDLGEYCEEELALFRRLTTKDSVAVDVGANIGALTIPLAAHVRHVYALEPQPYLFNMLCGSLALNDIRNVTPLPVAATAEPTGVQVPPIDWDHPGGVQFGSHSLNQGYGQMVQGIPALMPCDFMKIDVEGFELDVLKGATPMLLDCKPWLFIENDRADKSAALVSYLRNDLGYLPYWFLRPYFRPENFNGVVDNNFKVGEKICCSIDLFCFPPGRGSAQGLIEATPDKFIWDYANEQISEAAFATPA